MISDAELKRIAFDWKADPMIVDLDYVLGAFLSQLYRQEWAARLRFKGGTCLRKCYFPQYRFSEDLDFTAEEEIGDHDLDILLGSVIQQVQDVFGINMRAREPRVRLMQDSQGGATIEVRLYYRGPLQRTGAPQAIQLHITTLESEFLAPAFNMREIIHPYSDQLLTNDARARCYSLQEILSEKLRALSGQRRFAISRDLFDVYQLLSDGGLDLHEVRNLMKPKFEVRGLNLAALDPSRFVMRKAEFQRDWNRNLQHLLPYPEKSNFEKAWSISVEAVDWVASLA